MGGSLPDRNRILVVNNDVFGPKMAGPAIRALHISEQLARFHDVRLVGPHVGALNRPDFITRYSSFADLHSEASWADVIVLQGFIMEKAPWLLETDKVVVVDLYDPMHLEYLTMKGTFDHSSRVRNVEASTQELNKQMTRGDFFVCANQRQRDFWLGALAALGRLGVSNYDADPSGNSLIAVCPFGLPSSVPARTAPGVRGIVPGIAADDRVVLWAGGVFNWFDPLTLVLAIDKLSRAHHDIRLFFLGMTHPNPTVPQMRTAVEARRLAARLGLTGRYVFFNEGWVPYNERQNYLLDADLGVCTHFDHLETRFSFRTRMLDYLWAAIPMVSTEGDYFGSLIQREGLGKAVPVENVDALAEAINELLYDVDYNSRCRQNVTRVRQQFYWESTLKPLLDFCARPHRARDAALVIPRAEDDDGLAVSGGPW
jgi:glycosyltransferase involved in cell wall biosynthesis